jgi:5-methylthioadenosine/S-adenosylhomocysteine deaminase
MTERTLLIEGGHVFTADDDGTEHEDGFVLVRGDRIVAVGAREDAPSGADERLDASGCIVVPGLVNTHQHPWYCLFKGLGDGMLLEQWIGNLLEPTARAMTVADLEVGSRLGCLEMIASGTTTCLNHSVTATDEDAVEASLRPVAEMGMRQVFAKEVRPDPLEDQLALAEAVHARWHGAADGRIAVALVLECTAHWVAMGTSSEELIVRGNELARRLGVQISAHVAGGTMSRDQGYLKSVLRTGRTDIEFLHGLGVLDEKWLLAHAIHVRDRDIELIAAAGAFVTHTPTSESSRGGGITPVRRMQDAGICVSLGTDGPMVDTSVDMVEQMKAVGLFQNQLHLSPTAVTPRAALRMATSDAAASIGLSRTIGSLEAGKQADVAVFDLGGPHATVWHDPVSALVHSLRGRDVRTLLVAGEALVSDGRLTRIDDEQVGDILGEARERSAELLGRADVPAATNRDRAALKPLV